MKKHLLSAANGGIMQVLSLNFSFYPKVTAQ